MRTAEKNIHIIFLFLLGCRLVFIFSHTTNVSGTTLNTRPATREPLSTTTLDPIVSTGTATIDTRPTSLLGNTQDKIQLNQDISILEIAYQKNKDSKIAKTLIEKLAQNYEFEKANKYLQEVITNPEYDQSIEPTLHLYIVIHDPTIVSITDLQSIKKIIPIMDEYKSQGRLDIQDYNFYQGLIKLRYKDYKGARELFNDISSAKYKTAIQSITQAISQYNSTKAIPKYYQDALVALSLLKNGYFSIAKKLALETALQDNKYILPYQILAYTHFLTNNREAANDYFLKLADVDSSNRNLYKFLIGVSFYRAKEYNEAVLYLSQVDDTTLQTDSYRYLLLSYNAVEDTKNMIQIRQKLLGQKDISESDYYEYFYQAFYKPYSLQEQAAIYEENKILSEMYVTNCITTHTGANMDVCTYGKIGLALTKDKAIPASESTNLVTLAEKYNESYLFRIIGDVYLRQNNREESKKNYAKALSLSTNSKEQDILKIKISQIQ